MSIGFRNKVLGRDRLRRGVGDALTCFILMGLLMGRLTGILLANGGERDEVGVVEYYEGHVIVPLHFLKLRPAGRNDVAAMVAHRMLNQVANVTSTCNGIVAVQYLALITYL